MSDLGKVGQAHNSTKGFNPPQNMRLASNGMSLAFIFAKRGSFITLELTRSRCTRDLYKMYANTTVSPAFSLTLCRTDVCLPGLTSSATHSTYSRAPCSRQILPAFCAMHR